MWNLPLMVTTCPSKPPSQDSPPQSPLHAIHNHCLGLSPNTTCFSCFCDYVHTIFRTLWEKDLCLVFISFLYTSSFSYQCLVQCVRHHRCCLNEHVKSLIHSVFSGGMIYWVCFWHWAQTRNVDIEGWVSPMPHTPHQQAASYLSGRLRKVWTLP